MAVNFEPEANSITPAWSPDGKWIAYTREPLNRSVSPDSNEIFIMDSETFSIRNKIGYGNRVDWWHDSVTVSVRRMSQQWHININSLEAHPFFEDSTRAWAVLNGSYVVFEDLHTGPRKGIWFAPSRILRHDQSVVPVFLGRLGEFILYASSDVSFAVLDSEGVLWIVSYPTAKRTRVPAFMPTTAIQGIGMSRDGKEILYTKHIGESRLVLIEDLLK
jgi:hypothetical protein